MANVSSNQSWWDSEMANELRSLFYNQYYSNTSALNFLNGRMRSMIAHPTGFSPEALAALKAQATDTTATQFAHAQQAVNARNLATGSADLPSGVAAQLNAGTAQAAASQNASEQQQIALENEQLKNNNYWKAVQTEGGVASAYNPGGYIADSLDASAGVGPLANAATNVNNSSFGHELGGSIAQGLGGLITGQNISSLAKAL